MLLLKSKWEDREITGEPLYINSLIPDNFISEHPGAEVAILEKNPIAVRNKEFHVEFDKEKLLSGTYNLKYELDEAGFDKQGRSLSSEGWDVQYKVHI